MSREEDTNVAVGEVLACATDPLTGFHRDGCCATGPEVVGSGTVCAQVTPELPRSPVRVRPAPLPGGEGAR